MWRVVLFICLVIAGVGTYYYFFERESLARHLDGTPLELPAKTTEVYKWRDAQGKWHISDERPDESIESETLQYRSDDNILPSQPPKD